MAWMDSQLLAGKGKPRAGARQRGSAILIVMVLLIVMAIMGAAYMQWCRASYEAAKKTNPGPKVGTVARATAVQIAQILGRDLVNADGDFFDGNPATLAGTEPYDYPVTNRAAAETRNQTTIYSLADPSAGSIGTALGGHNDDSWLASTVPDFSSSLSAPTWPHITNLNGVFLVLPEETAPPNRRRPIEHVVDFSDANWQSDSNLKIAGVNSLAEGGHPEPLQRVTGVDADGDGVLDSRWTWAPITQIDGISYIVAVRIVDLSAAININSATSATSDGDSFVAGYAPRGLFPSAIDMSRLFSRIQNPAYSVTWDPTWVRELYPDPAALPLVLPEDTVFGFRGLTLASPPAAPGLPIVPLGLTDLSVYPNEETDASPSYAASTQTWVWQKAALRYGYGDYKYNLPDLFQMRYKNGLNSTAQASDVENQMASVVRRDATGETTYADVDYSYIYPAAGSTPTGDQMRLAYFQGADTTFSATTAVGSRVYPTIRQMLTTMSGAACLAPNPNNVFGGARTLKYDLQWQVENLYSRIFKILNIRSADGTNGYLGLDAATVGQVATEFAAAIHDYADADLTPSLYPYSGVNYYGLERLPFLREVYVQAGFEDKDVAPVDTSFDTWRFKADSQAMAIELGNPFDRPMDFSSTATANRVRVRIAVYDGATPVGNPLLLDETACTFSTTILPARGRAVIYSNPTQTTPEPARDYPIPLVPPDALPYAGTKGASLVDLNFTQDFGDGAPSIVASTVAVGTLSFPMPLTGSNVSVQLQVFLNNGLDGLADTADDVWVRYDELRLTGANIDDTDISHSPWVTQANAHAQASVARDGRNLRYLSNGGAGVVAAVRLPAEADQDGYKYDDNTTPNSPVTALNRNQKGAISNAIVPDNFEIPHADRTMFSVAELGWILMFGFNETSPGGSFPEVFDSLAANRRFLDLAATARIPDTMGMPHAAMLLDQFTTLSPRNDGVDNDNDDRDNNASSSADNDSEQLVPGTINVNTAPLHLLTLAVPLPETVDDVEAVMKEVINFRDNPSNWRSSNISASYRVAPGIANLGELMWVNPGGGSANTDLKRWSGNDDQFGTDADVFPMPEELNSPYNAVPQRALDGPEETMSRFYGLAQSLSTRSDFYAAYIVVQGYASGDFRLGALESMRVLAIFDRSAITSVSTPARIVAIFELDY